MNVICGHEEMTEYRNNDGDLIACLCAHCGLPEGTPVISCTNPGEIVEWWHNDAEINRREKFDRIGANKVMAAKDALVNERRTLRELHDLESMFGDVEQVKAIEHRLEEVTYELRSIWP